MTRQVFRIGLCLTILPLLVGPAMGRELTLDERVAAQRSIENVYWQHRIWPAQNHGSKPPLGEVLPESAIRAKVSRYLGLSDDLASKGTPISEQRLREEMNRMVTESRAPEVLRELFAALGDDPFVIGETLVRQKLVARLAAGPSADTQQSTGDEMASIGGSKLGTASVTENLVTAMARSCAPDTWSPTSTAPGVPQGRESATAVWTGAEMVVWGGNTTSGNMNTGGRYDPATDSWTPTSTTGAPTARSAYSAVWTGTELVVWGGADIGGVSTDTGGRYNPATDTWVPTTTSGAPQMRFAHTAVWTGTEMVVWGGVVLGGVPTNTGGRYNPTTGMWVPTATSGATQMRYGHAAFWTGTEMVVWGGRVGLSLDLNNTGGRYNPATDVWAPTTTTGAPPRAVRGYSAIWTGTDMVVWGGFFEVGSSWFYTNTGRRYNPATDMWAPTTTTGAPEGRQSHTAVWTGSGMIIWGGQTTTEHLITGGRYSPATDLWAPITTTGAPSARVGQAAVWTGTEMIIWAGSYGSSNTGGRYCPDCDDDNPCTSDTYDPSVGCVHTAVPDGPCCLTGQPVSCDDGNLCTIDTCNPPSGCSHTPVNCDDGNTCTTDSCDPATGCLNTLEPLGTPCDDANACTMVDTCDATGHCIPGPPRNCDDGNPCNVDVCNPNGVCVHYPNFCDDHNACTMDLCNSTTGCVHLPGCCCDDHNICNGVETCDPRTGCRRGVPLDCDDGNACTIDHCETSSGCFNFPQSCDDGNICNGVETCDPARGCVTGTPLACDDGNICTNDSCDAASGCVLASNHSCDASPNGLGYWKRLCEGPVGGETLTNFDVACVNDACTFSAVASVADLCDRLYAKPTDDKCEQGEAEFMALLLNACRLRVAGGQAADAKKCTNQTSVGGIRAEADSLLCSPGRDKNACVTARCESQEVNEGKAVWSKD